MKINFPHIPILNLNNCRPHKIASPIHLESFDQILTPRALPIICLSIPFPETSENSDGVSSPALTQFDCYPFLFAKHSTNAQMVVLDVQNCLTPNLLPNSLTFQS